MTRAIAFLALAALCLATGFAGGAIAGRLDAKAQDRAPVSEFPKTVGCGEA